MGGSDEYLLRENFKMIDADNSGIISPTELQRALGSHGLLFSLQTISLLIKLHSTRGTGTLDFSEYVSLNNFLEKTQSEFAKFDVNKDGKLGKAEVFRALNKRSAKDGDKPRALTVFRSLLKEVALDGPGFINNSAVA